MLQKVNICGVDTAGLPKLTHQENEELMVRLKQGDQAAREKFIVGNMRLVLSLVKRFWAKNANADDVFQAGCVGLIKAIDGFDLSFNVKFSTYAVPKTLGRRNARKGVFMTRKQAIFKAILKIRAQKGQNEDLVAKLTEIADAMPFVKWSEGTVRDCVEQFMSDHGRLPSVTDFKVKDGMPAHALFPYLFKMTAHEWMERNFPTYYKPSVTIRQALETAIEVAAEDDETAGKLRDILSEYPLTKWNEKNISDGLETFFDSHGYLPRKEDYQKENYLPFIDIYRYRYKMRRNAWIELHCPVLMQKERARGRTYKQSSLHDFAKEYERIKPFTEEEFNQKRSKQICCAEVIMRYNKIKCWQELLACCGLKRYTNDLPPVKLINNVITIVF